MPAPSAVRPRAYASGRARDRHRRGGLHRLARRRRPPRARRRGHRARQPFERPAREPRRRRRARRGRHPRRGGSRRALRRASGPDACFHLAAQADVRVSVERPDYDCEVNVARHDPHPRGGAPTRRTDRLRLDGRGDLRRVRAACAGGRRRAGRSRPYGTSKLAAEEYLATYERLYGATPRRAALRQRATGRARIRTARPASSRSSSACSRPGGTPTIFGDGRQTRDYVYVGDVVRATLAAREHATAACSTSAPAGRPRCSSCTTRAAGWHGATSSPSSRPPATGRARTQRPRPELAARELGFRGRTSLEDGLRATWEWIREKESALAARTTAAVDLPAPAPRFGHHLGRAHRWREGRHRHRRRSRRSSSSSSSSFALAFIAKPFAGDGSDSRPRRRRPRSEATASAKHGARVAAAVAELPRRSRGARPQRQRRRRRGREGGRASSAASTTRSSRSAMRRGRTSRTRS